MLSMAIASVYFSLLVVGGVLSAEIQVSTTTDSTTVNETVFEDAYEQWLESFGPYILMEEPEPVSPSSNSLDQVVLEAETAVEGGREVTAPIAVRVEKLGLLNPHLDYEVVIESQVEESGSLFVILNPHDDKSRCGLGGLSSTHLIQSMKEANQTLAELEDLEIAMTSSNSTWEEVSQDFWWAKGNLSGGGVLGLSFTPPECGCLFLSVFFSLPVENMTLVAGPHAFPNDMRALFCVDDTAQPLPEEEDVEEVAEEEEVSADLAMAPEEEEGDDTQEEKSIDVSKPKGRLARKKAKIAARKAARKAVRKQIRKKGQKQNNRALKKQRMQQIRDQIREAGLRVTRWRVRQRVRLQNQQSQQITEGSAVENPTNTSKPVGRMAKKKARKARKQAKKARKPWRRLRKQQRRNRMNQNGTLSERQDLNETVSEHQDESDSEVDILMNMLNGTEENELFEHEDQEALQDEEASPQDVAGSGVGPNRQQRKRGNRRHRKRGKQRVQKRPSTQGIKFCCKHGINRKKVLLNIIEVPEGNARNDTSCNTSLDIITTFAGYKFSMDETTCQERFIACCNAFTEEVWKANQGKKERRQQRKQNRKARRQEIRRQRQEMEDGS